MMKGSVSNPQKVLAGFVETNQFDKIGPYCQQHGISPDYVGIIRSIAGTNPDAALNLAKQAGTRIDINQVAEIFISFNNLQGTTAYLLDVLKENKSEHGHLQTKLLELNITAAPQVAETIM
jgi:clathrin heavy chain